MWASSAGGNNNNDNNTIPCSPSKSSSNYSSPSSPTQNQSSTKKSMEEIWRDITLTENLNVQPCFPSTFVLQDFLARPLINKVPSATRRSSSLLLHASSSSSSSSLSSTPPNILNLASGSAENVMTCFDSPYISSLHGLPSSSVLPSSFCKKRVQERGNDDDERRHKRMIKNRESAARSRARKQAYTQELETEIANLLEENAKLGRQQDQQLQAGNAQVPKKLSLHRTLTAPF